MISRIPILAVLGMALSLCGNVAQAVESISVLFVSNHAFSRTTLDARLREKLAQEGLRVQVDTCNYKEITADRMTKCNLLIITYPSGVQELVQSKFSDILEYVRSGGGLVVMGDDMGDTHQLLNEFLRDLDAEIVLESPVDPSTLYQQPGFLRHWFCTTENIIPHKVSEGVRSLWYPLADDPDNGRGTQVLRVGPEWTSVILANPSTGLKDYKGIIGAHTVYSKGSVNPYAAGAGSVKEYCDIAKSCGYGYIAFTETFENMTLEKWDKLIAECKAESDDGFAAIPGIEIEDVYGNSWITLDMPRWPTGLDALGRRIESGPGYYFGICHTESLFAAHYKTAPKMSLTEPWNAKFYCGLEVFSYNGGNVVFSEALDYYLRCQGNAYNLIPVTSQRVYSPKDVYYVEGILTRVRARRAAEVPHKFRAPWGGDREVYVSAGPELTQWNIENGLNGFRDEEWRLNVGVRSDVPLKYVTLYDRDKVFRRFIPRNNEFHQVIAGYHDVQRFFVLIAEDVKGRKLVSSARYTSDHRQSQYMCTDMQNTLNSCYYVTSEGKEERCSGVGYAITSWDGVLTYCTTPNLLPESGIELGHRGWQVYSSAFLPGSVGAAWSVAARDMAFGTGDCNVLRNIYHETPSLRTISRHTRYTPRLNGINAFRVQHTVTLLKDFDLPSGKHSEWMTCLRVTLDEKSFPTYVVVDRTGRKTKSERNSNTSLDIMMSPGSYFASFPYIWGPFAVMPLSGQAHFKLNGNAVEFGHEITDSLKAGTSFHIDVIFIIGRYDSLDEADYDLFRSAFGLDGGSAYSYRVSHGKLLSHRYIFALQAEDGWAGAEIGAAGLESDLPINICGLNENWDAGLLDLDTGRLRRVGIYEGGGILSRNIDEKPFRFACGNIVTCDNTEIMLSVFERNGKWSVEAHNPTPGDVNTRVRTAPWMSKIAPALDRVVLVPAGKTETILLYAVNKRQEASSKR